VGTGVCSVVSSKEDHGLFVAVGQLPHKTVSRLSVHLNKVLHAMYWRCVCVMRQSMAMVLSFQCHKIWDPAVNWSFRINPLAVLRQLHSPQHLATSAS
jgi:hypothetical protein